MSDTKSAMRPLRSPPKESAAFVCVNIHSLKRAMRMTDILKLFQVWAACEGVGGKSSHSYAPNPKY